MAKNIPEVIMSKVNLIGETTNINGDLSTDDDLRIDGIVNGNIKSNKRIIIGATAKINGNISANTIEINGTVKAVSYTHLRAHETPEHLVCRLLLEKKTPFLTSLKRQTFNMSCV